MWEQVTKRAGIACLTLGVLVHPAQVNDARGDESSTTARAALQDRVGNIVATVTLEEAPAGVRMTATFRHAVAGTRGFHIHETGLCEPSSFESAGGHFAPGGTAHGFHAQKGPHAGDLPNVHVAKTGETVVELFVEGVTLSAGDRSLLDADGSALVLHADKDDYRSDPAGEAGDRIACGVIRG